MTLTLVTGLMTAGKTTQLINTFERAVDDGLSVLVISADGRDFVADRGGRKLRALPVERTQLNYWYVRMYDLVLVDEAQFLTPEQVRWLHRRTRDADADLVLYGLSHDFRGEAFPGTREALRLASTVSTLPPPPCAQCGERGEYNARIVDGKVVKDGPTKVLKDAVTYEPRCWECWV